ncbi:magnesium/cobalt transporter CorA [Flavobacterium gelidilacus]|uniref:magnesium/cobalt transporter CorA n=1 Tax=Flavobacterium gelidilacus TaxID=206041 RepID=UPI0004116A6D|nr:magnesium/cobalt transporter CorA [Flavobacterium gelidilacus]
MRKIKYKKGRKIQPTQVEYTGIYKDKETELQLFVYNDESLIEFQKISTDEFFKSKVDTKSNWLNIHGLNNVELIKSLTENLKLNPLIVSDIVNISRGTSLDELDNTLFFSVKSILPNEDKESISIEQISFLLQEDLVVSFQEKRGDFFTHIRERLRTNTGIVRKKKVDFLLYLLLDAIIENFYITIEAKENKIEELLALSKVSDDPFIMQDIEKAREIFHLLKRSVIPLRDALYTIKTIKDDDELNFIEPSNFVYFGRLHQKTLELIEQIEYDMNALDSASNFFYTAQSHRMNEVMKILTVISSVFMPLTFIAGIYGMNFDNLPELHWKYSYFFVLGIMFLIVLSMIYYFKKKKWF